MDRKGIREAGVGEVWADPASLSNRSRPCFHGDGGDYQLAPARLSLPARIDTNGGQTSACGAAFSGDEGSIPRFRAKIPHFTSKIVEHSRYLLKATEKQMYADALNIYAATKLDFADAVILARMKHEEVTTILSFDTDFDDFPEITRREPEPAKKEAA